jgi:hypothetical protein
MERQRQRHLGTGCDEIVHRRFWGRPLNYPELRRDESVRPQVHQSGVAFDFYQTPIPLTLMRLAEQAAASGRFRSLAFVIHLLLSDVLSHDFTATAVWAFPIAILTVCHFGMVAGMKVMLQFVQMRTFSNRYVSPQRSQQSFVLRRRLYQSGSNRDDFRIAWAACVTDNRLLWAWVP